VISGKAGFQMMGDWAKGEFINAKKVPGTDFLCFRTPGTQGNVSFNSDQFVMFKVGADKADAQIKLASAIMEPGFQSAFNVVKGSVPARTDVPDTAFDACGNRADCIQTVTVLDTTAPLLTCARNQTLEFGFPWSFTDPLASDGCNGSDVTVAVVTTRTNRDGFCGNTFSATRTWRATDACGNQATCGQTVTVVDTTPPEVNCPTNKIVECTTTWAFDVPTATDTCGTNRIVVFNTTTNTVCGESVIATRIWRITDACGNQAQCSQTVTVVDTTPPSITCPTNKTVECTVPWTFDAPSASDTCGTNSIAVISTVTNATCGNTFTATRTWRATDACGNQAQCSQTVTVVDTTPPVFDLTEPHSGDFIPPSGLTDGTFPVCGGTSSPDACSRPMNGIAAFSG